MTVWKEEVESLDDFVKRVQKIVMKKTLRNRKFDPLRNSFPRMRVIILRIKEMEVFESEHPFFMESILVICQEIKQKVYPGYHMMTAASRNEHSPSQHFLLVLTTGDATSV
ncbi:hypothetical protein [Clostridium porci]|uniref:Uncharacterized protein n=1 Tax=Clostridium porci TaxID=2605778 RepID=A0A7X2TE05_9CLOT|nr:hypothetical protein [Clostridium porci]MSS38604.1 hypothetical protein [Clostridium porci]